MKRYFDNLKIRNRVEVKIGDYTAYSYDDYFMNTWVGNINIFKEDKPILHATIEKALNEQELKDYLERYIKK